MKKSAMLLVGIVSLAAAGCGSNSDSAANNDGGTAGARPGVGAVVKAVPGCDEGSFTDLEINQGVGDLARCSPGSPAALPLASPTKIVLATADLSHANALALRIGIDKGEFEKENLEIELKTIAPNDALPLLAKGQIDVQMGGVSAGLFNAISKGFDIRWAMPVNWSPEDNKVGLWARGSGTTLKDLKDMKVGTATGPGSLLSYSFDSQLKAVGLKWSKLQLETLPAADLLLALKNGAVGAAMVGEPQWFELEKDGNYSFLMPAMRVGEPLNGLFFGPSMTGDRREAGVAFTRAYIRTVNTYLRDTDYKRDPAFCKYAASVLETDSEVFCATPGMAYDYEVKKGLTDRMQAVFMEDGSITYPQPIPQSKLVDWSYVEQAIGHSYKVS